MEVFWDITHEAGRVRVKRAGRTRVERQPGFPFCMKYFQIQGTAQGICWRLIHHSLPQDRAKPQLSLELLLLAWLWPAIKTRNIVQCCFLLLVFTSGHSFQLPQNQGNCSLPWLQVCQAVSVSHGTSWRISWWEKHLLPRQHGISSRRELQSWRQREPLLQQLTKIYWSPFFLFLLSKMKQPLVCHGLADWSGSHGEWGNLGHLHTWLCTAWLS